MIRKALHNMSESIAEAEQKALYYKVCKTVLSEEDTLQSLISANMVQYS